MKHKFPPLALAAAFALASMPQSSYADPRDGSCCGDGGRDGGDWIINGTALTGIDETGEASLKVEKVLLSGGV